MVLFKVTFKWWRILCALVCLKAMPAVA